MKWILVALLLLSPLAIADHVYSHRFVVDGRLVGSDGLPLPGRTIAFRSTGDDFLENCREGSRAVTDQMGDFVFCYHHHGIGPDTRVTLTSGNASLTLPVDVALRREMALLQEPNETGAAPENWSATYRVSGRVWRPGPVTLEGVPVFGEALGNVPVNLTVGAPGQTPSVFHSTTDHYGDFDLVMELGSNETDVSATIEAFGKGQPISLNETFHRTYAPIYAAPVTLGSATSSHETIAATSPGSDAPRVSPILAVGAALALIVTIWFARKK